MYYNILQTYTGGEAVDELVDLDGARTGRGVNYEDQHYE